MKEGVNFSVNVTDKIDLTTIEKEKITKFLDLLAEAGRVEWVRLASDTKRHQGEYRRSFRAEVKDNEARIYTDLAYARYVEEGRGPVVPENPDGVLCFELDGEKIFTRHVKEYEGRHDIPKVVEYLNRNIEKIFEKVKNK